MDIGQFELALRVAVGLFVVVAPTLLFLGLWHGLIYLRDDDLIERARRMDDRRSPTSPTEAVTGAFTSVGEAADASPAVCEACGTPNAVGMRFCRECFEPLPEE